ncbi:ABC transporter ATP-binding protein [Actinocatenispora thailandica]|uniref:ABC transporter ATP-binding protein n=1 Tax=Actinocatenispora thailandica TaxID=227318 RepID=A0A7R7I0W8_9ACTN|nr:ABC transporter ATP-binding protein [Actinocatenispora thailandica]BCJ38453.1 ABC transporter ATP-binding protein [Actinocatenispora thailandica]
MEPLLRVRDLRVRFGTRRGGVPAVDGVSFDVYPGETVAVVGESGSGKSVTMQAVMGLLPRGAQVSGSITYRGTELVGRPLSVTRALCGDELAMIFQDPLSSLNPVFRVGRQITEALVRRRGMSRAAARDRAVELMTRVGIPAPELRVDEYPHQFSGGMRQRAMIAMALAMSPRLLIADEPTTALDVTVQAQIMRLLASLRESEGMALALITHDLGVVADAADRVALMYAGRVVEAGPTREVYEHCRHPYTEGLLASVPDDAGADRLVPIPGQPPNPASLPAGCAFHPRCRYAIEPCRRTAPALSELDGHSAACHRSEEVGG